MRTCIIVISSLLLSFNLLHAQPSPTPSSERVEGIARRNILASQSLVKNVPFRNIGPTVMSGRVVDIDVNPNDPTEFYVAYASGGLWYTRNNGQSFVPIFDHEDVITIGDFAVNWNNRNIWIGTGEVNSSRSSYSGIGVYFSADTGKTWQYKGLPESHHIGAVILHPNDAKTVWVAVLGHLFSPNPERGVYKTTDGGATWKQVLSVDDNTGAVELQLDPKNSNILYASMWHRERRTWNFVESGSTSGIYKSIDGGTNWSRITTEASGFPTGDGVGRIGVSVFPGNTNILYAVVDNQNKRPEDPRDTSVLSARDLKEMSKEKFLQLPEKKLEKFLRQNDFPEKYVAAGIKELVKSDSISVQSLVDYLNDANNSLFDTPIIGAELYRSEDGGKSWKKTNIEYMKSLYFTYGYYFGKVFVSPLNDQKVVLSGYTLIMSTDGGKTFKEITGDNVHADHHAVWMNSSKDGHIISGNDGGLNISYDDGLSWFKANTPPVGQFYSVNVDMDKPYNVYGGLQDNGVWTGSSATVNSNGWHDSGQYPYKFIMGGDGMQVMVDTRDNATVYTGYQFGYYYRFNKNNPDDAFSIHPRNDVGEPNLRFNWQTPIWLSVHNQDILYFGTNRFHRSMRKGEDLKTLSSDLTAADRKGDVPFNTITAIHESPLRFGLIYAGTDDGRLWVSKDAGYTWSRIDAGLPQGVYVSRVVASAHAEGRVYVSLNGCRSDHFLPYIYCSDDFGATWKCLSTSLPAEPVNVIREDPEKENLIFAGTDNGVYLSLNQGQSWMAMSGGLPRVAVHDMVIHPRDGELVVATHGRSLYIASLGDIRMLDDSLRANSIKILRFDNLKFSKGWGKKYYDFADAPQPKSDMVYFVKDSSAVTVRLLSEAGKVLVSDIDTASIGLNYKTITLCLDDAAAMSLQQELRKSKKDKTYILSKAEDGKFYPPIGKYTLELTTSKGETTRQELLIKDPSADK